MIWFNPASTTETAAETYTILTIGEGLVAVDVTGERRWLLHAIPLLCASAQQAGPTEMLRDVHRMLTAEPAPSVPLSSEIFLNYIGTLPQNPITTNNGAISLKNPVYGEAYDVDGTPVALFDRNSTATYVSRDGTLQFRQQDGSKG